MVRRVGRREVGADNHRPVGLRHIDVADFSGDAIAVREVAQFQVGPRQMVHRQHAVRLAAAERSLELYDRVAALTRQPLDACDKQRQQALGQVRAAEELNRVLILGGGCARHDLRQVSGELRLNVVPAGNVRMRGDDIPPGLEAHYLGGLAVERACCLLRLLTLLLVAQPQHALADLLDARRLFRRGDHLQQALCGVGNPVRLIVRESLLMCPTVARFIQLADVRAPHMPQLVVKDIVPVAEHECEQLMHVEEAQQPFFTAESFVGQIVCCVAETLLNGIHQAVALVDHLVLADHVPPQAIAEGVQHPLDSISIA